MKRPYVLAMRELEERREKNLAESERRRDEVLRRAPELAKIEAELNRQGTCLLRCVLNRNEQFEPVKEKIRALQAQKTALLRRLQLPADWLEPPADCPVCGDTGFDAEGRRCDCLRRLISKYVGESANLSEKMREQTFERFDFSLFSGQEAIDGIQPLKVMQKAYAQAERFADSFDQTGESLLIMGGAGTGKTFLSSCIANRALQRGKAVYYQTAYKLFTLLEKLRFGKEPQEDAEQLGDYIYQADLLILDDLGTEFLTQFTAAALFDLLNSRLTDRKSTVISTNLSFADMERLYAQRTVSRLLGEYSALNILGRDLRLDKFRS